MIICVRSDTLLNRMCSRLGERAVERHLMSQQNLSSFIWSVADLLRGDYQQSEYGNVILPVSATVTGRIDAREFAYQETT